MRRDRLYCFSRAACGCCIDRGRPYWGCDMKAVDPRGNESSRFMFCQADHLVFHQPIRALELERSNNGKHHEHQHQLFVGTTAWSRCTGWINAAWRIFTPNRSSVGDVHKDFGWRLATQAAVKNPCIPVVPGKSLTYTERLLPRFQRHGTPVLIIPLQKRALPLNALPSECSLDLIHYRTHNCPKIDLEGLLHIGPEQNHLCLQVVYKLLGD
jgi:hypothetical protein